MTSWKIGDLRIKKVSKRAGDLLQMNHDVVWELVHDQEVWEVQKLTTYAGTPEWVSEYFSLEDPNKVWEERLEENQQIEAIATREAIESKRYHRYHLQRRKEQELEQRQERKRYNRWYRRVWRAIRKPPLATAKVVKE